MIDRRTFLGGATAATVLGLVGAGTASAEVPLPVGPFPPLAPLPPGAPVRRLFSPVEQRFAPYLAILPAMVNDVSTTDPATLGFFGGGWWRTPSEPYNARVQEHVYTLSWFYANRRPWHPYYLDPALRNRLEAALAHYLNLQHADGSFPEYSSTEKSKAATGFGLGYLAKTLANLRRVNALPARRTQLEAALHLGMTWFLNPANPIWAHPVEYANQNTAGLSSAQFALNLIPDTTLGTRLHDRIEFLAANGQSPAGFFYEPTGMDVDYNFEVMLPELAEIHALTGNRTVLAMARKFADWFGYNVVREPDGSGSLTYVATSSRTHVSAYDDVIPDPDRTNLASLFVPEVPALAAFFTTREDRAETRRQWATTPGPVPGPAKQDTSPRILAHVSYGEAFPSRGAKQAAIRQLPYLRSADFAVQRRDDELNQAYLYVRRPQLYLAGFWGTRPSSLVRGGPGMLWHPRAGMVVHSQQEDTRCWAALLPNGNPDARGLLDAAFSIGDRAWDGSRQVPGAAPVVVRYGLDSRIRTVLTITRDTVTRAVQGTTPLTEQIPLVLHPGDDVRFADGTPVGYGANAKATASGLTIRRGGTTVTVGWGAALTATVTATTVTFLRDGARRLHVLRVPHPGTLTTEIRLR